MIVTEAGPHRSMSGRTISRSFRYPVTERRPAAAAGQSVLRSSNVDEPSTRLISTSMTTRRGFGLGCGSAGRSVTRRRGWPPGRG